MRFTSLKYCLKTGGRGQKKVYLWYFLCESGLYRFTFQFIVEF